jgi:hypothetical protein
MANQSTSLRGPLLRLQKSGHNYYSGLAKKFSDNSLISETWHAMAQDYLQLGQSLRALPRASVGLDKADEEAFMSEIKELMDLVSTKVSKDGTLQEHMARALDLEERITTKIYAPLIYRLKADWTDRSSDFYIRVKAHITRLNRLILPCAGDPSLIHRTHTLLEKFEQEIQRPREPEIPIRRAKKGSPKKAGKKQKKTTRTKASAPRKKVSKSAGQMKKRGKSVSKRSKPLIKNVKVSRRRASR